MDRISVSETFHQRVTSSTYPTPKAPEPNQLLWFSLSRDNRGDQGVSRVSSGIPS